MQRRMEHEKELMAKQKQIDEENIVVNIDPETGLPVEGEEPQEGEEEGDKMTSIS